MTFTCACQENPENATPGPLHLLFWREGREFLDTITIEVALPEKYATVPVAPDGFFGLRDAKGRLHFFVEVDRGTMTLKRFTRKLRAYAAYDKEKKHTEKFGIKKFRVLTVTSSATRCKNLVQAAAAAEDVRDVGLLFLFATEQDLPLSSPGSVFTKIWTVPGENEHRSFLGGASQKSTKGGPANPRKGRMSCSGQGRAPKPQHVSL